MACESRPLVLLALGGMVGFAQDFVVFAVAAGWVLLLRTWRGRGLFSAAWMLSLLLAPAPGVNQPQMGPGTWSGQIETVPTLTRQGDEEARLRTEQGRFRVRWRGDRDVSLGDWVSVEGRARAIRGVAGERLKLRRVIGDIRVESIEVRSQGAIWFRWGREWRNSFRDATARVLPPDQARMLDALCFNVDAALDSELAEDLKRSGVIHIVSASGLHVTAFALILQILFGRLPIPRLAQLVLLVAILAIYAGAAGLRPPVFRAAAMAILMLFAYVFRRDADTLSSLGLAALVQMAMDPTVVFDVGFQLSYVIVFAMGLYPYSWDARHPWDRLKSSLKTSWVATLAASPVVAYYFGVVSLVAVLANLAIAPLMLPILLGALGGWTIMGIGIPGGELLLRVTGWLTGWIELVAGAFAELPFAALEVAPFPGWAVLLGYLPWIVTYRFRRRMPSDVGSRPTDDSK